jgi:hypothetical protein
MGNWPARNEAQQILDRAAAEAEARAAVRAIEPLESR